MKVCILGSKGFVGSRLFLQLKEKNSVTELNRDLWDFKNNLTKSEVFSDIDFDFIIHCVNTRNLKEQENIHYLNT